MRTVERLVLLRFACFDRDGGGGGGYAQAHLVVPVQKRADNVRKMAQCDTFFWYFDGSGYTVVGHLSPDSAWGAQACGGESGESGG